jgi:hypothetical protein
MNAIPANAMVLEHVLNRKRHKRMGRRAYLAGNAHRAIAWTGIAATRCVMALVCHAVRRKKAAA